MRVSNQWIVNSFLRNLNRNQEELCKTQIQVSSGKQIERGSENPVNNALAMQHKTEIYENDQYIKNISRTTEWLDNTDSSISTVTTILQRARELAVQGANDTLVQTDRDAIAEEIDQLLQQMVDVANTDIAGEYIFAGVDVTTKPFETVSGLSSNVMTDIVTYSSGDSRENQNLKNIVDVKYLGDGKKISTEVEKGVTLQKNITGLDLFYRGGTVSSQPSFSEKLAPLDEMVSLETLNDGRGVQAGSIILTDSNGIDTWVDLKSAIRLDDVLYAINSTGSFEAGIDEVPSDTATALGILQNAGQGSLLVGQSDPAMVSEATPLSQLNSGTGVPEGFLSFNTRDGRNVRLDISGAVTVGDVVDLINNDPTTMSSLNASFDMVHNRLQITDLTGGSGEFSIESKKNQLYIKDLPAHTASDLGIIKNAGAANSIVSVFDSATESEATPLSCLNDGKGVEKGYISITGHDGTASTVDLRDASTLQSVIDAVNTQTAGRQTASYDVDSKRIVITDNTVGANAFQIQEVDGVAAVQVRDATTVAKNLGLLKSAQGKTLVGDSLVPAGLTEASLLSTIVPPPEIGMLNIRGADDNPIEIDLSSATTIGDVVDKINATQKFSAVWDPAANRFVIDDVSGVAGDQGIRVEEKTNSARDLGFVQGAMHHSTDVITSAPIAMKALPTLIGSVDLNPDVEKSTELSALNCSSTFNKGVSLGVIRITDKAGHFKAIDLRGSKTVEDVLDKINDPQNGLYIEAKINSDKNGIEILDKNHGATGKLEVIDIDSTTASDLGIVGRTVDQRIVGKDIDPAVVDSTSISSLRTGEGGVPMGKVYIQSGDYSGEIDLTGVKTVGELKTKLSTTDTRFNLSAWIDSDGKRLNLTNTEGQSYIKVRDLGETDESSASALGLGGSRSIFETLTDLRDSLYRNDATAISEQSIKVIQEDIERALKFQAEVGVKTNRMTASKEKQENITLNLNKMLDVVENVDMTEAITRMTQLETAFEAALQTGAKVLQTTLMDFLQ